MAGGSPAKRHHDANDDAMIDVSHPKRVDIDDFDNIVTVLVGKEEKRFTLHQEAVCAKSKFFKAACSKQWREGQEKMVRLPEVEATTFKRYCSWIYSGDIQEPTCTQASSITEKNDEQMSLIKLYLLGDSLDDIGLRNRTVPTLFRSMRNQRTLINNAAKELVWKSTPPGSPVRKMIVDVYVWMVSRSHFTEHVSAHPAEFIQEVAAAALKAFSTSTWDKVAEKIPQYKETEEPK